MARQPTQLKLGFSFHGTDFTLRGDIERQKLAEVLATLVAPEATWETFDDPPQAVVSHESALAIHNLSDLLPGKVHLTVPRRHA